MAIIISQDGKDAVKIDESPVEEEKYLQEYIHENPDSIPLYESKANNKLLILAREFPTDSGPIDAIGVDKDGEIYIIETKIDKNPDKRLVVAQVLDYGASLWRSGIDFGEFESTLDSKVMAKFSQPLKVKLADFFSITEDDVTNLLENMRRNLNDGRFKFVILMNKLQEKLKDLIVFINENSKFDVYAVELEFYKHDTYEILIPKLFGAEVKKDIAVSGSSSIRRKFVKWTEEMLLEDAERNLSNDEYDAFKRIYDFSKQHTDKINYGTGAYGTFSPIFSKVVERSLFTLGTDKRLSFNFEWTVTFNEKVAVAFKEKLESIGFSFPDNFMELRPSVTSDEWVPRADKFITVLSEIIEEAEK